MNVKNGGDTVELKEGDQAEPGRGGLADEQVRWSKPHPRWLDLTMYKQLKWCWQGPCCQAEVLLA